jgi:hypothetical protein
VRLDGCEEWGEDQARTVQKGGREMEHSQKKSVLLVAVLAITAGPVTARAEPAEAARADAKKHYDRAMELNEDGQVAEAIVELKRAYEIAPHHAVLYNLGQAYITLAKPVDAVAALQRYLDEGGKAIKPARRAEVEQEIARQKTRIATLAIRGLPDGAVVTIDGDDVGKAPLPGPVRVGVGKHVVSATAAGHEAGEAKIEVAGEDSKVVELKLVAKAGQPVVPTVVGAPVSAVAPSVAPSPAAATSAVAAVQAEPTPATASPTVASTPPAAGSAFPSSATSEQTAPGVNLTSAQGEVVASADVSKGRGLGIAGAVGVGAGFAGLLAGAILWEAAKSKNDDAVTQLKTDPSQARGTRNQAEDLATGANVCLLAGGVLAGAGTIATIVSFNTGMSSGSVALAPAVGPSFAGLTAKGVW